MNLVDCYYQKSSSGNYALLKEHTNLNGLLHCYGLQKVKLDLGCGFYKPRGFLGLDNMIGAATQITNKSNLPDILIDLNTEQIPFPDNSCIEVRASHYLEHSNVPHILSEVFRVLSPGGIFTIIVPYANSAEGMYPGHNVFFTEKWFEQNIQFQDSFSIERATYYPSDYWNSLPFLIRKFIGFEFARRFLFNTCWQMELICLVKK